VQLDRLVHLSEGVGRQAEETAGAIAEIAVEGMQAAAGRNLGGRDETADAIGLLGEDIRYLERCLE
jgi:hypothetical protein